MIIVTEEYKQKIFGNLNKFSRNGKDRKVKVEYSCSYDNIKIALKKKTNNKGKTQVISHRENPQLKVIKNNNINNTGKSYTIMQAQRNVYFV